MEIKELADLARKIRRNLDSGVAITSDTDLFVDLGFDSLDITELMYSVEDHTGVLIDYSRLKPHHLRSIGALAKFLASHDDGDVA